MTGLVEKLLQVEKTVSKEKGTFSLFALFLREDAPDKWDLVISAPWIESDKEGALRLVSAKVRDALDPRDLLAVSRIVFVEPGSPAVDAINRAFGVEHSTVEVHDSHFFGLPIRHAHIFSSRRQDVAEAQSTSDNELQQKRRKPARR